MPQQMRPRAEVEELRRHIRESLDFPGAAANPEFMMATNIALDLLAWLCGEPSHVEELMASCDAVDAAVRD